MASLTSSALARICAVRTPRKGCFSRDDAMPAPATDNFRSQHCPRQQWAACYALDSLCDNAPCPPHASGVRTRDSRGRPCGVRGSRRKDGTTCTTAAIIATPASCRVRAQIRLVPCRYDHRSRRQPRAAALTAPLHRRGAHKSVSGQEMACHANASTLWFWIRCTTPSPTFLWCPHSSDPCAPLRTCVRGSNPWPPAAAGSAWEEKEPWHAVQHQAFQPSQA